MNKWQMTFKQARKIAKADMSPFTYTLKFKKQVLKK